MPRSRTVLLLLLLGLAAQAAGAATPEIRLAVKWNDVYGEKPQEQRRALEIPDLIVEQMRVETAKLSAALMAVGKRLGAITMGPESELVFRQGVIDVATGAAADLDFLTQVGQFRFVFMPKPKSDSGAHQVVINTPKGTSITLYGTDVYVAVSPAGDVSVYVAEGEVEVRSAAGAKVRVPAGQQARVTADGPPSPPAPLSPLVLLPSDAGGFPWQPPAEWLGDPPGIDLLDQRGELPK